MLSKRQRKINSSFLLLTFALTTLLHYSNQPSDAERDPNEERLVVGVVTIVAGLYMAATEASEGNFAGAAIGTAVAASGLYILTGSSDSSSSSSGSNDASGGTSSMQPAPPETDATGQTVYH